MSTQSTQAKATPSTNVTSHVDAVQPESVPAVTLDSVLQENAELKEKLARVQKAFDEHRAKSEHLHTIVAKYCSELAVVFERRASRQ
ncbi:hypothetical protein PENSPDRAFT_337970 [Peniophora sp. CONT]|nr:hypothetical protein PENSPDRAFT_337970 [Peniophora sp. CONT]